MVAACKEWVKPGQAAPQNVYNWKLVPKGIQWWALSHLHPWLQTWRGNLGSIPQSPLPTPCGVSRPDTLQVPILFVGKWLNVWLNELIKRQKTKLVRLNELRFRALWKDKLFYLKTVNSSDRSGSASAVIIRQVDSKHPWYVMKIVLPLCNLLPQNPELQFNHNRNTKFR